MAEIDELQDQIAALEASLAGSAGMVAAFDGELSRMRDSLVFTGREVNTLSSGISGGLRKAFDGLIFDGMKLSDALKTVAQTIPKPIFSMARPANSGPTMSTAVSLANAQNTGSPSAGINRATAITQIFGASAATVLATPNRIRMLINSRLRGKRAQ